MVAKVTGVLALLLAGALLAFPQQAAEGARQGLAACLGVLVPSLYPFLVLMLFLVKSGAAAWLGRRMGRGLGRAFALPPAAAPALLMGMLGGYPTGARGAQALYDSGEVNADQAARMVLCCVNAGPAFVCTAVGMGFLGSARAGWVLLGCHLLAGVALGLALGWRHRKGAAPPRRAKPPAYPGPGRALVCAARDAAASILLMCCFVLLFSTALHILQGFLTGPALAGIAALCEVTLGCRTLAGMGAPLWCLSLALGWGGLCVHMQVLQGLGFPVRTGRFFLCRAVQGLLAALLTLPAQRFFLPQSAPRPQVVDALCSVTQTSPALSGGIAAGAALLLLCAVLLLDSGKRKDLVV